MSTVSQDTTTCSVTLPPIPIKSNYILINNSEYFCSFSLSKSKKIQIKLNNSHINSNENNKNCFLYENTPEKIKNDIKILNFCSNENEILNFLNELLIQKKIKAEEKGVGILMEFNMEILGKTCKNYIFLKKYDPYDIIYSLENKINNMEKQQEKMTKKIKELEKKLTEKDNNTINKKIKEILKNKEIESYLFNIVENLLLSKYDLIPKQINQNQKNPTCKINFLGDSITAGSRLNKPGIQRFTTILEKSLNIKCHNEALSGSRIAKISNDQKLSFLDRIKKLCKTANFTFIFGGVNDYKNGTLLGINNIENSEENNNKVDTFYGGVKTLLDELLKIWEKEKLCFILPLPTKRKSPLGLELNSYLNIIKEICSEKKVDFVDFSENFKDEGLFADGLHPNEKGHELLKELIEKYLVNKGMIKKE